MDALRVDVRSIVGNGLASTTYPTLGGQRECARIALPIIETYTKHLMRLLYELRDIQIYNRLSDASDLSAVGCSGRVLIRSGIVRDFLHCSGGVLSRRSSPRSS